MISDDDSLFGSPPPSPRPSASICDNEHGLTDTQNVGTIALPGSHPYSELPINPLALPLNHTEVHRPPAQVQGQSVPTSSWQKTQPWQPFPAPIKSSSTKGSKKSRQSSQSPQSPPSLPQSRDPEFSLPDPSAPPPIHFLRNQQNLLGKAGLVAGVKPSNITHIRGTTPSNPIIVDDEDTPILGRQSQHGDRYINPDLLSAPTNEEIVSVLINQKDIFPVLEGILGLIGKNTNRHTPAPSFSSRNDASKHPPIKRRKLNRVPAGATDWDVPYPFPEGEGPDEYRKTWERERGKHLVAQLVKLIKIAARKAATKNYLRKEEARQAAWKKLQQEMMPKAIESEPIVKKDTTECSTPNPVDDSLPATNNTNLFDTWMNFLQAFPVAFDAQSQSQSSIASPQNSTPSADDFAFLNTMGNDFDFGVNMGESIPTSNTAAIPDDLDALISSMLNSLPQDTEATPVPPPCPSTPLIGDDAIHPSLLDFYAQPSSNVVNENFSMPQAESPVPSMSSSGGLDPVTPTLPAWEMSIPDIFTGVGGDGGQGMFRPTLWDNFSQGAYRGPTEGGGWDEVGQVSPISVPVPQPRPKNTVSQSRKKEILGCAREKKRQVQEELDKVKTQLWETTIEQAALVHLLKRHENDCT